jgi:hypothetical protein
VLIDNESCGVNQFTGKAIWRDCDCNSTKCRLWCYSCLWQVTVFSPNTVTSSATKRTVVKLLARSPECNLKSACIQLIFPVHARCTIKERDIGVAMLRIQQCHTFALRWNMLEACALHRNLNQTWAITSYFQWTKKFQGSLRACNACLSLMEYMPLATPYPIPTIRRATLYEAYTVESDFIKCTIVWVLLCMLVLETGSAVPCTNCCLCFYICCQRVHL